MNPAPERSGGRALVLGGGGVAGIAWETGVLHGLATEGVDLVAADLVVGTSAGATVGAQVTSGEPLAELYRRQEESTVAELVSSSDVAAVFSEFARVLTPGDDGPVDPAAARWAIARFGLTVSDDQWPARRAVLEARLPSHHWPDRDLRLVVVDADTGQERVLDRTSGVALVDAVAASCAVPGVWPPVTIDGHRYVDGGLRSSTNEDLALGCSAVVVLAPSPNMGPLLTPDVRAGFDDLHRLARVLVVAADEASSAAFGPNPLDPATRGPAARAGLAQGRRAAAEVAAVWEG